MTRRGVRAALSALSVVVFITIASPPAALAEGDACTVVQPGIEFPLPALVDLEKVSARWTPPGEEQEELVALNGNRVLRTVLHGADVLGFVEIGTITVPNPDGGYVRNRSLRPGDLDGDGIEDLLVVLEREHNSREFLTLIPLLATPRGGFEQGASADVPGSRFFDAELGAFRGGEREQLALFVYTGSFWHYDVTFSVHEFNRGSGWRTLHGRPLGVRQSNPVVIDWDEDGRDDIVVSNRHSGEQIFWLRGDAENPLGATDLLRWHTLVPHRIATPDLDGDGRAELLFHHDHFWVERITVHAVERGEGGTAVPLWSARLPWESRGTPLVFDADGDGRDDIAYSNYRGATLYFSDLQGGMTPIAIRGGLDIYGARDLDLDGTNDLLVHHKSSGSTRFLGLGERRYHDPRVFSTAEGVSWYGTLSAHDYDGDGDDELMAVSRERLDILDADEEGHFTPLRTMQLPTSHHRPVVGDIDGDGWLDIVAWSYGVPELHVAFGRGPEGFEAFRAWPLGTEYGSPLPADLDGDGDLELVLRLPRSAGHTTFAALVVEQRVPRLADAFSVLGRGYEIAAGDIDGDGRAELLVVEDLPGSSTYQLTARSFDGETFSEARPLLDKPLRAAPAIDATDLDGDSLAELVLRFGSDNTAEGMAHQVYGNLGGTRFERITELARDLLPGWTTHLADHDGDSYPDFVPWSQPATLAHGHGTGRFARARHWHGGSGGPGAFGDFRGRGAPDLVTLEEHRAALYFVLQPQLGAPLAADSAPPEGLLWLDAEVDHHQGVLTFDNHWWLSTSAKDDCWPATVLSRRIDLIRASIHTPVSWMFGEQEEVRIFTNGKTGENAVLLIGPDEGLSRWAFRRAIARGGYPFRQNQLVRVITDDQFGAPADRTEQPYMGRALQRTQRFLFSPDGALVHVEQRHPYFPLTATLTVRDASGREAVSVVTFDEARTRYCDSPGIPEGVCHAQ